MRRFAYSIILLSSFWVNTSHAGPVQNIRRNDTFVEGGLGTLSVVVPAADSPWQLARISQKPKIVGWKDSKGAAIGRGSDAANLEGFSWKFPRDPAWGDNVLVYVIDSGVNPSHSEFASATIIPDNNPKFPLVCGSAADPTKNPGGITPVTVDKINHGTGVAANIVGAKTGVAKKARIVPVKIANDGSPNVPVNTADVIAGLTCATNHFIQQKAADPKLNRNAVINLSWRVHKSDAAANAIRAANAAGMHVIIAAGNDFDNLCHGEIDPADAALEWVADVGQITVTSIDPDDGWVHNYGSCVHLAAPGMSDYIASITDASEPFVKDGGSSLAAPLVSGVVAAILSVQGPMDPAAMKALITGSQYTHTGVLPRVIGTSSIAVPAGFPDKIFFNALGMTNPPLVQ